MPQVPQQSTQENAARRDAATDGGRQPQGGEAEGLENRNVTRPTPPQAPEERAQRPAPAGLENQNVTKPAPP